MKPTDIFIIALMIFNICVVGPLLMIFWTHTYSLERRTAVMCSYGMQAVDPVACPDWIKAFGSSGERGK